MSQISYRYATYRANRVSALISAVQEHPGGSKIILKYAGRDATDAYEPIHPPDALERYLPKEKHLGSIESAAADKLQAQRDSREKTEDELRIEREHAAKPPLNRVLDLQQMEVCSQRHGCGRSCYAHRVTRT